MERSLKEVGAVTFDVGGTLIECRPSVGHIYAEVAARSGHANISPELLDRKFKTAWSKLKDFRHTRQQWADLVDATFHGLIKSLPSKTFFPELYERFSEPEAWRIFDDVVPVLEDLRGNGIKLGVISNWDDRLRPLLRKLHLDSYFQTIIVSCEVGFPKPAPLIFECACAALACPPGRILHVGDSRVTDFEGATAAGLQALWLSRSARRQGGGTINSLRALDKI